MKILSPIRQLSSVALALWLSGCSGQALVSAPTAPQPAASVAPDLRTELAAAASRSRPRQNPSPPPAPSASASPAPTPALPATPAPSATPALSATPAPSASPALSARPAPSASPTPAPSTTPSPLSFGPQHFLLGTNLPWVSYGNDFGANAWDPQGGIAQAGPRAQLDSLLTTLVQQGVKQVRWFMLTDGRSGIRFAADGTPLGLDDYFFADVDAALAVAQQHSVRVMFTLLDFKWCSPAQVVNGVQMGGHLDAIADPAKRQALLDNVIKPILARYGANPSILAWDIMNEPEWATYGVSGVQADVSVSPDKLQDLIGRAAGYVHSYTAQQATVGSAGTYWLHYWTGLGLDFYQTHWYDYMESYAPLAAPVASLGLDKPVILGEFPTANSQYSTQQILDAAYQAGYGGVMPWAATLVDDHSTGSAAFDPILGSWALAHPELVLA